MSSKFIKSHAFGYKNGSWYIGTYHISQFPNKEFYVTFKLSKPVTALKLSFYMYLRYYAYYPTAFNIIDLDRNKVLKTYRVSSFRKGSHGKSIIVEDILSDVPFQNIKISFPKDKMRKAYGRTIYRFEINCFKMYEGIRLFGVHIPHSLPNPPTKAILKDSDVSIKVDNKELEKSNTTLDIDSGLSTSDLSGLEFSADTFDVEISNPDKVKELKLIPIEEVK